MKSVVIDTPGDVRVETLPDPVLPDANGAVVIHPAGSHPTSRRRRFKAKSP